MAYRDNGLRIRLLMKAQDCEKLLTPKEDEFATLAIDRGIHHPFTPKDNKVFAHIAEKVYYQRILIE